eukprot:6441799-Karenia_brevis.AAC.1
MGSMYEGCQPLPGFGSTRPDDRGPCGCYLEPEYCKYNEGSCENRKYWVKVCKRCTEEADAKVEEYFAEADKLYLQSPYVGMLQKPAYDISDQSVVLISSGSHMSPGVALLCQGSSAGSSSDGQQL